MTQHKIKKSYHNDVSIVVAIIIRTSDRAENIDLFSLQNIS